MATKPVLLCATPRYSPWVATANRLHRRLVLSEPPSICPIYRLVLVDHGTLNGRFSGADRIIRAGQMALLLPGTAYDLKPSPGLRVTTCTFGVIAVDDDRIQGPNSRLGSLRPDPKPMAVWGCQLPQVLNANDIALVQPALLAVSAIWWQGDWERFTGNRMLGDLLASWAARHRREQGQSEPPASRGADLYAYAEERLASGVTVSDLARVAGLSRTQFSRTFRRDHGMTPRRFLQQMRLDRASSLLASIDNCAEVARRCGYASYAAFSRAFYRKFGRWPSDQGRSPPITKGAEGHEP